MSLSAAESKTFTDLDGTMCFQEREHGVIHLGRFDEFGNPVVKAKGDDRMVSAIDWSTRLAGQDYGIYVDIRTAERMKLLKASGMEIIPVTGARGHTMKPRFDTMKFVKRAVIENGGRIVDNELNDDQEWLAHLAQELRALQDMKAHLSSLGIVMDNEGRKAMIRIRLVDNPVFSPSGFDDFYRQLILPSGLKKTRNLGHIDIIPERAGKGNAIDYLLDQSSRKAGSVFGIGDDLNDRELLKRVDVAYVLGSAHAAILKIARRDGYIISREKYFAGINEILDNIAMKIGVAMPTGVLEATA